MTNPATVGICIALNQIIDSFRLIEVKVREIAEIAGLEIVDSHPYTVVAVRTKER